MIVGHGVAGVAQSLLRAPTPEAYQVDGAEVVATAKGGVSSLTTVFWFSAPASVTLQISKK